MKKKFFAVALATTMVMSTAVSAMAATADVTIGAGFSANTGEEKLSGDFNVTYTFTNKSADTSANWYNFIVEMHTADSVGKDKDGNAAPVYIDMRSDNFGWLANQNDTTETITWDDITSTWDTYATDMADAECTVNIVRSGNTFTVTMAEASGKYNFKATTTAADFAGQDAVVYLTGEKVALSNVKFTNNAGSGEAATTAAAGEAATTKAADTATTAAAGTATTKSTTTASKTGDVAPVAALAAVAAVACAAVVVSRKKVTE